MATLIRFIILYLIKLLTLTFYKLEVSWVGDQRDFTGVRCFFLLNHTSLFEPLYGAALDTATLWEFARNGMFPGADVTMKRPIAGRFFKLLSRDVVSVTRKRDDSWKDFLDLIDDETIVIMAAEGRMKRPSGLDKSGKPMSVRGGAADVIQRIDSGKLILVYSGGLHHIQRPGQRFPHLFKRLKVKFEVIDITTYKDQFRDARDSKAERLAMSRDLDARRDQHCPEMEKELMGCCLSTAKQKHA